MKKASLYLGMAAGVLAVVFAVLMIVAGITASDYYLPTETGTRTAYSYYGGDAYTGIQQAAADTARNVKNQSATIVAGFQGVMDMIPYVLFGFGGILLCMGLGMIAHFANQLAAEPKAVVVETKVEAPAAAAEAVATEPEAVATEPEAHEEAAE